MRVSIPKSWLDWLIGWAMKYVSKRPDAKLSSMRSQTACGSKITLCLRCALHEHWAMIARPLQFCNLSFMLISNLIDHRHFGTNIVKNYCRVCRSCCYYVRSCFASVPAYGCYSLAVTIQIPYPVASPNIKDRYKSIGTSCCECLSFTIETQ